MENLDNQLTKQRQLKNKFSANEDQKLKELVAEYGTCDWYNISQKMKNRSSRQCRERWFGYLSPDVLNGPWSDEEDKLLLEKYIEFGPAWKTIVDSFPSRTGANLKYRYNLLLRRETKKLRCAIKKENKKKYNKILELLYIFDNKRNVDNTNIGVLCLK